MTAAEWCLELCDRIAEETDVAGETTRLFLSPAARRVQGLLQAEMIAGGMSVRVDAAGNLRGVLPGAGTHLRSLILGSHVDTVPNAGRYDGILGVALPLALLREIGPAALPFDVELIAFSEEEGVRFRLPFIGSRGLTGTLGEQDLARRDADGVSVEEAMQAFDLQELKAGESMLTPGAVGFVEVHIEQGPVLEALGLPLAVVETIVGQTRYELTFTGQANHAGTTPMNLRHDALTAAATFILAVEEEAQSTKGLVATVGSLTLLPGAPNVVPGEVRCTLDIRHAEDTVRLACGTRLLGHAAQAATARGVTLQTRQLSAQDSVPMDAGLTRQLQEAAGDKVHTMNSGAGHDAMIMAPYVPSAMLFLRTPGGLSHHPDEAVLQDDVAAALATLRRFLAALRYAL